MLSSLGWKITGTALALEAFGSEVRVLVACDLDELLWCDIAVQLNQLKVPARARASQDWNEDRSHRLYDSSDLPLQL